MTEARPTPERILQVSTGIWAAGILAAATTHSVFAHIEAGDDTADKLAKRADISERGAQVLLDGLLALRLLNLEDGCYRNTEEARCRSPTIESVARAVGHVARDAAGASGRAGRRRVPMAADTGRSRSH